MNKVFHRQLCRYVLVSFNDILIYSMTWEGNFHHLKEVLTMLADLTFFSKMSKCEFGMTELLYLGHVIYQDGVKVDPEKIKAILEWAIPRNLTKLRGFISVCNYYNIFVKGYSRYTAPMTYMTKKGAFSWSEEDEKYFQ